MNLQAEILLDNIDGSGSDQEYTAIAELRKLGDELPTLLLKKYKSSRKWQVRSSCVYHSIRYSRSVQDAVQLGLEALSDKSKVVRYRACMLLAYSLRKEAIPYLEELKKSSDSETLSNANAAIDAIIHQNSNYFIDRDHSGKMTLTVN